MTRVSVFVDGENMSPVHALAIFTAAQGLGVVDCLRVYGDAALIKGWEDTPGFRLIHSGTGKNAADLLMTVDAMERALSGDCDAVVIASSDGDFRHLAERLRERGLMVLGLGEAKSALRLRASCTRFNVLAGKSAACPAPAVAAMAQPAPQTTPAMAPAGKVSSLTKKITAAIARHGCPATGMKITDLQRRMLSEHRVAIGCYPEKTWRGYLQARAQLFELDPKGPDARVRLRQPAQIAAE